MTVVRTPILQYQANRVVRRANSGTWALALIILYPCLLIAAIYGTWIAARFSLGHWPRESLDDPMQIGVLVDVPCIAAGLLMIGMPGALVGAACLSLSTVFGGINCLGRRLLVALALPAALWIATITLIRADPGGVLNWFMD